MSRHHRESHHTTATYHLRPELEARLPLPCVECGRPVEKGEPFHVAHLTPASKGGRTTRANSSVAHPACNVRAGGKLGAEASRGRRRSRRDTEGGIRPW